MHDDREEQPSHALLRSLQEDLPSIQYLALHQAPDLKCQWVFDFKNYAFLTTGKQKSFRPLLVSSHADQVEMQCAFYENTLEYISRLDDYWVTCRTEKEFSNVKLLEVTLKRNRDLITAIKPVTKNAKNSAPKSAKQAVIEPAAPDLQALFNAGEYELEKELSERSYLFSYKLKHIPTGHKWVLKCPHQPLSEYPGWGIPLNATADPAVLAPFDGPGLADRALIRPFIEAVSLSELVKRMNKLSGLQTWLLLVKMSKSLLTAHAQGQVHGNLTPTNTLIDRTKQVFLTDAGLQALHALETNRNAESIWAQENKYFLAPEYLTQGPNLSTDSYSLGALAAYMLSGHSAFFARMADSSEDERPARLVNMVEESLEERHLKLLNIIRSLLNIDPVQRPTIDQMTRQLLQESET